MGCGLRTPVALALLEVINRSTHQRARGPIGTAGLLPLHPQQRTKSVVHWRMALCAINGPEHLQ